jgi:hypothetical protein
VIIQVSIERCFGGVIRAKNSSKTAFLFKKVFIHVSLVRCFGGVMRAKHLSKIAFSSKLNVQYPQGVDRDHTCFPWEMFWWCYEG